MTNRDVEIEDAFFAGQVSYRRGLSFPAAERDAADQWPADEERQSAFVAGWRRMFETQDYRREENNLLENIERARQRVRRAGTRAERETELRYLQEAKNSYEVWCRHVR